MTCTHLAGRLISELLRGDAERFDAFAKLPHYPFPGGRSPRIPFTAMGAAYYSLRDRLGLIASADGAGPSAHAADSAAESEWRRNSTVVRILADVASRET